MSKPIQAAFENKLINLAISELIPNKEIDKHTIASIKFKSIMASVKEKIFVEQPVVYKRDGKYYILDGHLRIEALKKIGKKYVQCLIAKDDEDFTYNKYVNRVASIQEHKMIVKALDRGVSIKRLAKVLNIAEENLIAKRNLLDGICADVVEMLKNRVQVGGVFKYLKKLKPYRQIEAVNLMIESNNFAIKFAKALYMATPDNQLVNPEKRRRHVDMDKLYSLEHEVLQLQDDFKVVEEYHNLHILNLTVVRGYMKKMFKNQRIHKYIQTIFSELYEHFEEIVNMESLDAG